jgi:hypothetical protein
MTQSPGGNRFARHPVLTLGLTVLVAVVALDFAAGALVRALGQSTSWQRAVQGSQNYRRPDPILHHTLIPSVDYDRAEWGGQRYRFCTNSLGFRDKSTREVPLTPAGERLVVIGDSFLEGIGIAYEQTAAGLLDARFAARGVEVLNASVASYSPIHYLRKTRHLLEDVGLRFDRLVVFVDVSDIDDEANSYAFDAQGNVVTVAGGWAARRWEQRQLQAERWNLGDFVSTHTVLLGAARELKSRLRGEEQPVRDWREALGERRALWTFDDEQYREYGAEGLRIAVEHMTELRRLLAAHGLALTVVVYPWPDQLMQRDQDSRQVHAWRDWSAQQDSQFINLFPAFFDGGDPEQTIPLRFITGDVHWNAVGHALVADVFFRDYERLNGTPR